MTFNHSLFRWERRCGGRPGDGGGGQRADRRPRGDLPQRGGLVHGGGRHEDPPLPQVSQPTQVSVPVPLPRQRPIQGSYPEDSLWAGLNQASPPLRSAGFCCPLPPSCDSPSTTSSRTTSTPTTWSTASSRGPTRWRATPACSITAWRRARGGARPPSSSARLSGRSASRTWGQSWSLQSAVWPLGGAVSPARTSNPNPADQRPLLVLETLSSLWFFRCAMT